MNPRIKTVKTAQSAKSSQIALLKDPHEWTKARVPHKLRGLINKAVENNTWRENQEFKVYFAQMVPCSVLCCFQSHEPRSYEEALFVWKNEAEYTWLKADSANATLRNLLFLLMKHDTNKTQVTRHRVSQWIRGGFTSYDLIILRTAFVHCSFDLKAFFAQE
jgi:hypothetical protein